MVKFLAVNKRFTIIGDNHHRIILKVILLHNQNTRWKTQLPCSFKTNRMQLLVRKAARAARSNLALLIEGEVSTGKKTLARLIHAHSSRKNKPFINFDCSFPEATLNEVLFGVTADNGKILSNHYRFSQVNTGTLYLENIDKLPLNAQLKLVSFIEKGEVLHGKRTRKYDIRIIASTSANLLEKVREGLFSEDLFYRLNIMILSLPPLRERIEDIPVVAEDILCEISSKSDENTITIQNEAQVILKQHQWPKNLLELKTVLKDALAFCNGSEITAVDVARAAFAHKIDSDKTTSVYYNNQEADFSSAHLKIDLTDSLGELRPFVDLEADIIRHALDHYNAKVSEVSQRLGIGRSTLYRKMKEHGLEDPQTVSI